LVKTAPLAGQCRDEKMTGNDSLVELVARRPGLPAQRALEVGQVFGARKIPSPDAALGDGLLAARARPPGSVQASGLWAKAKSATIFPPMRCSWMMRSKTSGVQL
jgi:hypothetical protein